MGWDKRTIGPDAPCSDCPFRLKSAGGWLGGHPVETYRQPPSIGMPTTCHKTDRGADDSRSKFCAGALATIANSGVDVPEEYREAVDLVGKREDCFPDTNVFAEHHAFADEFAASLKEKGF